MPLIQKELEQKIQSDFPDDESKVDALFEYAEEIFARDQKLAINYFETGLALAQNLGYLKGVYQAKLLQGFQIKRLTELSGKPLMRIYCHHTILFLPKLLTAICKL